MQHATFIWRAVLRGFLGSLWPASLRVLVAILGHKLMIAEDARHSAVVSVQLASDAAIRWNPVSGSAVHTCVQAPDEALHRAPKHATNAK